MNVVSTSPSATEICYALGVEPVAVSHACDYPSAVVDKPRIDASRIGEGSSAERDRQLQEASAEGHVYDVHAERLRAAEPDLVVTQEVCGVCAVDATQVDSVLADLDVDPAVVGTSASQLADVFECIQSVAEATDTEERAEELIADLQARLDAIEEQTASATSRPRVAIIEWMDPIHIAANWVPELVELAGGDYGLAEPGQRSVEADWESIVEYAPEILVVAPCGYSVEHTREQLDELASLDGWESLPAVRDGHVYALDGSSYLTRWTPRLVDAAERLAAIFHPDEFGDPPADVVRLSDATVRSD